jgi:hypothetical protein
VAQLADAARFKMKEKEGGMIAPTVRGSRSIAGEMWWIVPRAIRDAAPALLRPKQEHGQSGERTMLAHY